MTHHGIDIALQKLRAHIDGTVLAKEPLAPYTAYRIGGPSAIWVVPADELAVGSALAVIATLDLPLFVLGRGTNLLVSDTGWPGITLYLGNNLSGWSLAASGATALAGTPLTDFIRAAVAEGLGGMEHMAGIPGSVGGALMMNAGAFGQEIEGVVAAVRGFERNGTPFRIERRQAAFQYRAAPGLKDRVVTAGEFIFSPADPVELTRRLSQTLARRTAKQPLHRPSCGSVFKRPAGNYAGALIEAAELKGERIGDAMISPKHAGFILNMGRANASEVYALICRIQDRVAARFGVRLEREVRLLGQFDDGFYSGG
ncbi:MAG: UDP-N-acetylmuramate dehydrogenase [Pseudomonadota bacterium]